MIKKFVAILLFLGGCGLIACNDTVIDGALVNESSFNESASGWETGLTDFDTTTTLSSFALSGRVSAYPSPLPATGKGLLVSSTNQRDTLFTFITKKITGLNPASSYSIRLATTVIARLPQDDSLQFINNPTTKLYIKGAVSNQPPLNFLVGSKARLNLHTGLLGSDGRDFKLLIPQALPLTEVYQTYPVPSEGGTFRIVPNQQGEIWVTLGSQTEFKGITKLYYDDIKITIETI